MLSKIKSLNNFRSLLMTIVLISFKLSNFIREAFDGLTKSAFVSIHILFEMRNSLRPDEFLGELLKNVGANVALIFKSLRCKYVILYISYRQCLNTIDFLVGNLI